MGEHVPKVYPYRWVILAVFSMLQFLAIMLWVTFSPITGDAAEFYGVTPMKVGFLSMISLIVTIFFAIPGAYAVDTWGVRKAVGMGAVLAGGFGFMRGLYGDNYTWVLICTWGFCFSHVVVFNSMTAVCARWFPLEQRATAVGIMLMALYAGIIAGMGLTPLLTIRYGIPGMLKIYGVFSLIVGVAFLVLFREAPPTPPPGSEIERIPVFTGIRRIFTQRDTALLILVWFVILGIFNAFMTWVEQIVAPRGFDIVQAGSLGSIMQVGGILGCFLLPALSDRVRTRRWFVICAVLGLVPGLLGLTFATGYGLLMASGFCFGFFLMGVSPVVYQYSAELSYPAPEATSQGLLIWAGQISGVIFIYGMDHFRTASGAMTPSLVLLTVLTAMMLFPLLAMRDSPMFRTGQAG
jgi:MFS family permease